MPGSPRDLATELASYTASQLESLVDRHLPDFDVPRMFAGHRVLADVRADLVFTLGLLHEAGVDAVAGATVPDAITHVLRPIDGGGTHTFFSYRVAETLARWGAFDDNPLLATFDDDERANIDQATDSSEWIELLDTGLLPANYAAVLSRCERARAAIGLPADAAVLDTLIDRVATLLGRNPRGYLDDAPEGVGHRYDIYTADIYLFTEPLADRLGESWTRGARHALDLVATVSTRDGTAIPWGRSTGALGGCLTIELGALALARDLTDDPARWLALAANAFRNIERWFDRGLINAHQHKSPYGYRGPERRLQMTLDCLGKLAYAAVELGRIDPTIAALPLDATFPERDELIVFDPGVAAGVWAFRSRELAFDVPLIGPTRSDYQAAPRNPSLFEVPVDSALVTGVPFVGVRDVRHAGGGVPVEATHGPGRLDVRYQGFPEVDSQGSQNRMLAGRRHVAFRVDGRTLRVTETLAFDDVPDAVSLQVAEAEGRPLVVDLSASSDHRIDVIDVSGLKEYRSFWGELPRVHQIDAEPAREVTIEWSARAKLRVATNAVHHHYHRSLYDPIKSEVHETSMPAPMLDDPARALAKLRDVDFFHLHWPEWFVPPDPTAASAFCDLLDQAQVRLVWTQHNLEPHSKDERHHDVYQVFAERADLVIHHSEWGRSRITDEYDFGPDGEHVVIPHGHFGALMDDCDAGSERRAVEQELGLTPGRLRVGIVGAPRVDKQTQAFMDAFARVERADLELLVLSLDEDEHVPDDQRITGLPYEFVDRALYNRRLSAIDVVALPFDPNGTMLTTGVVGDVIGLGLPAIVTRWAYLTESLGDAALAYGDDEQLIELLGALDEATLDRAATATAALRDRHAWPHLAERTLAALEALGTRKV
jgi:hypothetical protein